MIFLLTAFSTAKLGDLIGISSAPSPAGTRAITAVTVDPATGVPSKLVGLNASWGYFTDSSATADHANSLYYVMLAPSVATSVLVKIDVTKGAVIDQKEYDKPFGLLTYDYEKAELYASDRSFPTNLVDLAYVSAPPGTAAVPATAIAAAEKPPRAEKRLRSRPRMGLDNRPILPSL